MFMYVTPKDMTNLSVYTSIEQERPLGQWKPRAPTNYLFVTSRLKWYYNSWLIYLFHADLLPLKIRVTLTLTFQGHSDFEWKKICME